MRHLILTYRKLKMKQSTYTEYVDSVDGEIYVYEIVIPSQNHTTKYHFIQQNIYFYHPLLLVK